MELSETRTELYPYKLQIHQKFKNLENQNRIQFAKHCESQLSNNPELFERVVFSHEREPHYPGFSTNKAPGMGFGTSK